MIYLDYAATTPIRPEVIAVYNEVAEQYYGNASSLHDVGTKAERAITLCREKFAQFLNGEKDGVYFTSGGSEANILAVRSLILGNNSKGRHLITTEVEHASLYHLFKQLEIEGYKVTFLGVNAKGQIDIDELRQAIQPDTILASIQYANSETGVIQPVAEIGALLKQHQVIFHTDAVQAFGKIPLDVEFCKIDSVSIASHKIYGPKGNGACYIRPDVQWNSVHTGATHQNGFRMGTVDVPGVVAFTTAAELLINEATTEQARLQRLRTYFIEKITTTTQGEIQVEGHPTEQLPHIIGLSCNKVQGQYIMLECNRYGIAISTGSACQVGQQEPSRTMLATGKTVDIANSFIRLSFGLQTKEEEVDKVVTVIEKVMMEI